MARLVYLLGRIQVDDKKYAKGYAKFKENIYKYVMKKDIRNQLMTAIRIYIYKKN